MNRIIGWWHCLLLIAYHTFTQFGEKKKKTNLHTYTLQKVVSGIQTINSSNLIWPIDVIDLFTGINSTWGHWVKSRYEIDIFHRMIQFRSLSHDIVRSDTQRLIRSVSRLNQDVVWYFRYSCESYNTIRSRNVNLIVMLIPTTNENEWILNDNLSKERDSPNVRFIAEY